MTVLTDYAERKIAIRQKLLLNSKDDDVAGLHQREIDRLTEMLEMARSRERRTESELGRLTPARS